MRRAAFISATLGAIFLSTFGQVHASPATPPGAYAGVEQMAEADWLNLKTKTFYFASGWRRADPEDGVATIGFVGKGFCDVERNANFTFVFCSGEATGHQIPLEDFNFDPAMTEADLTIKAKGMTHTVTWTGEGVPAYGEGLGGTGGGVEFGAGTARYAPAEADIFGKHLSSGGHDFGVLSQDGAIGVFAEGRSASYENGVLTLSVRYRIPR